MKDLFFALLGPKHCAWCIERPPTLWDRLMRFDQLLGDSKRRPWERIALWWSDVCHERLAVWKLGHAWHIYQHMDKDQQQHYFSYNMLPVTVGMTVCTCAGLHEKVVEIDDGDIVTESGFRCSISHCVDPVPHPDWNHDEPR